MSIQIDTTTDIVSASLSPALTIGTGDVTTGIWAYFDSFPGTRMVYSIHRVGFSERMGMRSNASSGLIGSSNGTSTPSAYTASTSTWYWCVVSRESGVMLLRIFDDTTSTTPLGSNNIAETTDWTTINMAWVGYEAAIGNLAAVGQFTNFKVHTGVVWSDAECRTESQKFGIQKSGGTDRLCWGLETLDANSYGINEFNGGSAMMNNGAVVGANRPSQLEAAGGTSLPTYNRTQFQIGGAPIILNPNQPNAGYLQF